MQNYIFILFCKYLHSVIEEIPLACKTAVCLLVTHQPLLRSLNFFWLNKDITLRFSKRPQHKRGQPVSCIYIFMWLSCCCIWFELTFFTFFYSGQLRCGWNVFREFIPCISFSMTKGCVWSIFWVLIVQLPLIPCLIFGLKWISVLWCAIKRSTYFNK